MGIAEEYVKKVKTPLIKVWLTVFGEGIKPGVDVWGYSYYPQVVSCDINASLDQGSTTCTLILVPPRDYAGNVIQIPPMTRVLVQQGWNNTSTYRVTFHGFVDDVDYSNAPETFRLECRDLLKLAQDNYLIKSNRLVYSAVADESELDEDDNPMGGQPIEDRQAQVILTDLLTGCGIPERFLHLDFPEYPASGAIIIGNYATAVFEYETALDACMRICDLVGYRIWADKTGNIQCREVRPIAGPLESQTYQSQLETYSSGDSWTTVRTGNLLGVSTQVDDDLRNWIEVIGWDVKATVAGESDYVPSPPTYRRAEVRSYLLDTQELCDAVALRIYGDLNRLRYTATARIEGDPRIEIGQTIAVYDEFATGEETRYFVAGYTSTLSRGQWTMDLQLVGGIGTGSEPLSNLAPHASFLTSVEQEKLVNGSTIVELHCDASTSYDTDGDIEDMTYKWTVSGFEDRDTVQTTYVVSGISSIDVTLEVTDGGEPPLSDSVTHTVDLTANVIQRTIFAVTSDKVWYTQDGGFNWDSRSIY